MKKHILALTALTLAAALLSGCSQKAAVTPGGANYANSNEDSTDSDNSSSVTESAESTTGSTTSESTSEPESAPKERFIYGETEIPDISLSSGEYNGSYIHVNPDGRIDVGGHGKERYDDRLLESMVFETHTFGEYTIYLVGDDVRTDREHFPGIIYTKHLRVEVENNTGTPSRFGIENKYSEMYYFSVYPVGDFYSEELLFEDQIGNYLSIYDLKYPLIAMRYFNANNIDESLRKNVQFVWINGEKVINRPLGKFDENTGVCLLELSTSGFYAIFSADEFKVENENTLIDEIAGIKYIFDFDKTDDSGHYYSTERIQ